MAKIALPTIPDPGTFVYDPQNPTKYTEEYSFWQIKILAALSDAGFQVSDTDFQGLRVDIARDRDCDNIFVCNTIEGFDVDG